MTSDQAKKVGNSEDKMPANVVRNVHSANAFQEPFYEWQETEEINLKDYLDIIIRRKWLIVTVLTLVFLSTLIFTLTATRIYEASAVVEVSQETPHVTTFQEILGSEIQTREFYETQAELIRSKTMIDRVIQKLDLITHPVIRRTVLGEGQSGILARIKRAIKSIASNVSSRQAREADAQDIEIHQKVAKSISKNLIVSSSRRSMLIDVAFRSPDRQLSKSIVNTLVEDFIRWKMEQKIDASSMARDFLMMQMDRAKINLEKAEEQLNDFAKHAGIVSLDARVNNIYRHLEELGFCRSRVEPDYKSGHLSAGRQGRLCQSAPGFGK